MPPAATSPLFAMFDNNISNVKGLRFELLELWTMHWKTSTFTIYGLRPMPKSCAVDSNIKPWANAYIHALNNRIKEKAKSFPEHPAFFPSPVSIIPHWMPANSCYRLKIL